MPIPLTAVQQQRLRELDTPREFLKQLFETGEERDNAYQQVEKELVEENRQVLLRLRNGKRRPSVCELEAKLVHTLNNAGFVQVITPIILSRGLLEKMSITADHPLSRQVFWIGRNKCLRPMLAPHLYVLLRNLARHWEKPVRIFEIGSCFRNESKGSHHLNEFTMLDLVELGGAEKTGYERLRELVEMVMLASGLDQYDVIRKPSEVYGETIDIVVDTEVGSCALGPHILDDAWGIMDPWVGLGFGLERLVLAKKGYGNIQRIGPSLMYLDGARLNI